MQKKIFLVIGVFVTALSFAQSPIYLVPHKPDLTLSGVSSSDGQQPDFYSTTHNQRNGNPSVQMTGQQFSSSQNGYSVLVSHSNCMTANQALGIAMFTHRISADWSPPNVNSGFIQGTWYDFNQWDSMYFPNNGTQFFRSPSGAILNGTGNTNISNAWLAISGPFTTNVTWDGYYRSAAPLISQSATPVTGTPAASLNSFPRVDIASYSDSTVWLTGGLFGDDDGSTPAIQAFRGAMLNKGTWNGTQVTWVMDSIKPTFHTDATGAPDCYQNTHLSFSPDGQTGYCVFFGVQAVASTPETRTYNPIVYSTTDGGVTWSSAWAPFDFTTIPAIDTFLYPCNMLTYKKPWFSQSNGSDIVVDQNNQLHIICTIESGWSDDNDSLGYTSTRPWNVKHYIYDVYTTGLNQWDAVLIDSILTDPAIAQSPFAGIVLDARLQASVSPAGDHIFYLWADTDPVLAGSENAYPNMYGVGIDWSTATRTAKTQFTFTNDAYFHYNSNVALVSGTMFTIPSTNSIDRSMTYSMSTTFDHYYLNNVMFDQSVFFMPLYNGVKDATTSFGSIEVYPNPAHDILNLNVLLNHSDEVVVNMVNLLGETVSMRQYAMNAGSNTIQLNISDLETGAYIITVSTQESSAATRIIVQ